MLAKQPVVFTRMGMISLLGGDPLAAVAIQDCKKAATHVDLGSKSSVRHVLCMYERTVRRS